jgi:signal peptidase I
MMGDNRDNSLDSRWPAGLGVGLLPATNIVGRAEIVAASWKPGAGLFKPWTWLNLQWGRFLKPIR